MSTRAERAFRANRHILPIKVGVRQRDGRVTKQVVDADVRKDKRSSRKSGKQMMKELPIAHLSPARQRGLLLELVECFREGFDHGTANDIYRDAVTAFEMYDVDVTPDDSV
jgi:hypothetical protein